MSEKISKRISPRYKFEYNKVPTRGLGCATPCFYNEYGEIIDNVIDMADAVSASNGVSIAAAIETVCKDEGWVILPSHKKRIIEFLES